MITDNKPPCDELVSVVIPTYKRSSTLDRAIASVVKQSYSNIEIIVVDDNAEFPEYRSKTREIVSSYQNIVLVENERNLGGGLSRNAGIEVARGKYIAFLDDDDEYLPRKIEEQYNYYLERNNGNVAMVYCYAQMINVDGSSEVLEKDLEGNLLVENVENCIAATSWWFCPKDKLLSVGGFEDISSRQDASLLMKFFLSGYEVIRVPAVLLKYYWHGYQDGISKISAKTLEAEEQYRRLFRRLSAGLSMEKETRDAVEYLFSYRLAQQHILLRNRAGALNELRIMLTTRICDTRNIRIIGGILLNRVYRSISWRRNLRRVGR